MISSYNERAIKERLEKAAKRNGYELDRLPKLSEENGFAVACQTYARITRQDLERVDRMVALSRASAFNRTYRA